ncbi:MAG: hypothetical protein N2114_01345 [Candidatus Goldbacteria bacterium]|nr:hypothetical protein [Candidatus Goldiibacteriota bacterium]
MKYKNYKKFIVTTTINIPTEAIYKYLSFQDWFFVIVGDLKTPHNLYKKLEKKYKNLKYLSPEYQNKKYNKLSKLLGWNNIQRRNLGFIEAYVHGAEIIATVDDDNIPYKFWGKNIYINKEILVDYYNSDSIVADPLSITDYNYLWHRGFPIQLLPQKNKIKYLGKKKIKVLVQADLWNGNPDIDAIARIAFDNPIVKFKSIKEPFAFNRISPFNSQNTFLSREVIPYYCCLPFVGRMDDIWGSYILQHYFSNCIIYNFPSVYQKRNLHNFINDLEKEIIGYKFSLELINNIINNNLKLIFQKILPPSTFYFYKEYTKFFKKYVR